MRKMLIILLMFFISFVWSQNIQYNKGHLFTVESSIAEANRYSTVTVLDSLTANFIRHKASTARHLVADGVSVNPVKVALGEKRSVITYANNIRSGLYTHYAQDSCHVNGADITTYLPPACSYSADDQAVIEYITALTTSLNTHYAQQHSGRYNILAKEWFADYTAHCSKDTTDADDVHFAPDTLYNTVTLDTTNIDSTCASLNRGASRFNSHIADLGFHKTYVVADSVLTVATDYTSATTLINELRTKYNSHAPRDTSSTDSVHYKADPNVVTTASVSTASGHIVSDTATYSGRTHNTYFMVGISRWNAVIEPIVAGSTGASFYGCGSIDGNTWVYIDSVQVVDVPRALQYSVYWPYYKVYCNKRTDGTYKITLRGE